MPEVFDRTTTSDADRRRLSADERRAGILAAARAEFSRVGYHGTSTAGIARAAGCSEPMLYKHFASKRQLFVETLRATVDVGWNVPINAITLGPDIIEQSIDATRQVLLNPAFQQTAKLRYLALGFAHDAEVGEVMAAIDSAILARAESFLASAKRFELIRPDVTAAYVTTIWHGLIFSACWSDGISGDGFRQMIPHLEQFIRDSMLISAA